MKKALFLLFILGQSIISVAQNVGIGTTTPNSSAALDVRSTTKGLLIPSMTTSQRFAIASPVNGLMVYDTDKNEFYQYKGTSWKAILNGDYWSRPITNRNRISNFSDSVGIGLNSATERLDVAGNIRTNSSAIIDNASAILQLNSAGVNKGYMQLSGDNLRLGTNSGNTTGNVTLRMNGMDMVNFERTGTNGTFMQMNTNGASAGVLQTTSTGNVSLTAVNANKQVQLGGEVFIDNTANRTGIGTSSPTERLHVNGNTKITGTLNVDGEINRSTTGSYNLLPVCYGRVSSSGGLLGGTPNITSTSFGGSPFYTFKVECAAITTSSIIQITSAGGMSVSVIPVVYVYNGAFDVKFFSEFLKSQSDPNILGTQTDFHFIVYNP